jgi:hypothetical protein
LIAVALFISYASAREVLNRGLVAVTNSEGKPYIGWRLLESDPVGVAFNVYRETAGARAVKQNPRPITASTNLVDTAAPLDKPSTWFVRAVVNGREQAPSEKVSLAPNQVFTIKFQGDYAANKVAIADLNGDGVYDFVIKQPAGSLDPGTQRHSPDTYKLEAYDGKSGQFL